MRTLIALCLCLISISVGAQKLDHRLGYMIIQVQQQDLVQDLLRDKSSRFRSEIKAERILSRRLGIYLVAFDHGAVNERDLLTDFRTDRRVNVAQYDHLTKNRNLPDDPMFADQWQWLNAGQTGGLNDADTDADIAWDFTRGGVTATGDTIVVAIIDDGLDYHHPDIAANTWINHHEIPDNGIDEDGNGYIDDVYGWNAYAESPDVLNQGHGLSVAGMIGAVGNNGIGITGINWNVKLMTIVGGSPESAAIASYAYALDQRILYRESNGAKGAFVVSTNSSWGIDYGQPADAPLWCAFYDSLGVNGILSAAATANNSDNIDSVGDLPTACTSEFLLSVTALNSSNERTFSAFGLEHVDFGAPGDNIFTTQGNNGYGHTSGTSFASPVAAGLVALLYSAPCPGIAALANTDPAAVARLIRDIIFLGVEKINSLEEITKYGGSLNAGNSMSVLMSACSDCAVPFGITSEIISDEEVIIDWSILDTVDAINVRYKALSSNEWDTLFNVEQPLTLTGLFGCIEYVIEFESICADTSSGFQSSHEFKTDGCCELPATINVTGNETTIEASWSHVLAAQYYLIQWRPMGQAEWLEEVTSLDQVTIEHLLPCTFYEFRLQTNCDTTVTGFSETFNLRTRGCGNCIDLAYCSTGGDDWSEEYIESLIIGPLSNHSGVNNGYRLFEDFKPVFVADSTYNVSLRPGFGQPQTFDEQFRIWIDTDQDGVFDESELVLDSVLETSDTILISSITIPEDAKDGNTRMRVSMSFFDPPFNTDQDPCGTFDFGEVEDYCVTIQGVSNACPRVDTVIFDAITENSAFMYWPNAEGAIAYTYRYRKAGGTYTELATVDTTVNLSGLEKCTIYEVQVRTICIQDTTAYDSVYTFETDCDVAVKDVEPLLSSFNVYPNPVTDFVNIAIQPFESGEHNISIFNMQGTQIHQQKFHADKNSISELRPLNLSNYPPGLFFIVVEKDGLISTKKIVKL